MNLNINIKNCASACNNLGTCYEEGNGVIKDLGIAKEFYKRGALQSNPSAMSNYAYLLCKENDYVNGMQYFNIAHSYGCPDAAFQLGMIYENGCSDSNEFTIKSDICMALLYYKSAMQNGHVKSMLRAGVIYLSGPNEIQDIKKAMDLIKQVADQGNADAIVLYGKLHLVKEETLGMNSTIRPGKWDPVNALQWFKKAITLGHPGAFYYVGTIYEFGSGVNVNLKLAIKMYSQSAKLGFKTAIERVNDLEELGIM